MREQKFVSAETKRKKNLARLVAIFTYIRKVFVIIKHTYSYAEFPQLSHGTIRISLSVIVF